MSWEWFDFDPITGLEEWVSFESDGKFHIHYRQEVEPIMDFTKEMANSQLPDGNFKKEGWLYAALPMIAIMKMREKGFNALGEHGKDGTKYLLKEINENYPFFKCTHRHHAIK